MIFEVKNMKKIIAAILSVICVITMLSAVSIGANAVSSPGNTVKVVSTVKGGGGKITPSASFKPGQSPTYYVVPDEGYRVKQVWINGEPMGAITEFTFDGLIDDASIEVVFEKIPGYVPTTGAGGTTVPNTGSTSPDTGSQENNLVIVSVVLGVMVIGAFTAAVVTKKNHKKEN